MRQKMINLCPTTYEMAKKMPNFSGWIRNKLLETFKKSESEQEKVLPAKCEHGWKAITCQQWGPCRER